MTSEPLVQFSPPHGFAELDQVYGRLNQTDFPNGDVKADPTWEKANLVVIHNVAGTGLAIQLHKKVAPIFSAALTGAVARCPNYKVRSIGGYCIRHMRHDVKMPLSTHSWGCAIDINPDKNPMGPVLITDLPTEFIAAFTAQGFEWGGSWKGSKDPMHFQYATGV